MPLDRALQFVLSNAVAALGLALVAATISRIFRHPPLTRALWILVLLKLLTPPIWTIPIGWPATPVASLSNTHTTPFAIAEITPISDEPLDIDEPSTFGPELVTPAPAPIWPVVVPPVSATNPKIPQLSWPAILCLLWLTGAIVYFALILRSTLRIRRLLSHSVPRSPRHPPARSPPFPFNVLGPVSRSRLRSRPGAPHALRDRLASPHHSSRLALVAPRRGPAGHRSGTRTGPPPARRPLGSPPRTTRHHHLLVAPGSLAVALPASRIQRTMLRCMGRLDAPAPRPQLRFGSYRNR